MTSALGSHKTEHRSVGDIEYELVRKRVKNVNLRISRDGRILVSAAPRVPIYFISAFILSKAEWIKARQEEILEQGEQLTDPSLRDGELHYLWGEPYPIHLSEAKTVRCALVHNTIQLSAPANSQQEKIQRGLDNWYRAQIKSVIPSLLEKWQEVVGLDAKQWAVKKMRTKWGTCNIQDARIWLNLELAKYPMSCLEYVIMHELTHLHEYHHNKRFYALMSSFMPDWREREKMLENFFQEKSALEL